jgi:serine/threonine protein kinase
MDRIKLGKTILGEGGFGKVYLGTYIIDRKTGKKVDAAIKEVTASRMDLEEYQLQSKLSKTPKCNQHIVCMYDLTYDPNKDNYYIVMEYIRGKDLFHDLLATNRHLSNVRFLKIVREALEGLVFIHESGMAHGDIKLENLMLDNDKVKYIDFGFGCTANTCGTSRAFHGTRYLSPPEAYHHKPLKKSLSVMQAADVWALGSTFAEIITHRRTIDMNLSGSSVSKSTNVLGKVKRYANSDELPEVIYTIIEGMMQFDPKKRLTAKAALVLLN